MTSSILPKARAGFALVTGCLVFFWHIAMPRSASSDWPPEGLALSAAPGLQSNVRLAPDGEGGVFAVWIHHSQSGVSEIHAQRVGPDGNVVSGWPPAGLPVCTAPGGQGSPMCVPDGLGGVIVAWQDGRGGVTSISAQRIRADGTIHPGWLANGVRVAVGTVSPLSRSDPTLLAIEADEAGGVFVGMQWFSESCSPHSGCAGFYPPPSIRHVTAGGALGWGREIGYDHDWALLDIVPDGAGGAICATFRRSASARSVWVSRITSSGTPMWARELLIGPGNLQSVALAPDGFGGVFIACGKRPNTADFGDIWAQRLTSSGTEASGWPAGGLPVSTANGFQVDPVAALGEPGKLIVCWEDTRDVGSSYPGQDGDLFAQMLGPEGAPLPGWPVNGTSVCSAPRVQYRPQLAYDGLGGAWVTWVDRRDSLASIPSLFAARLAPTGGPAPGWPVDGKQIAATVSHYDYSRGALVPSGPNGAIVAWRDARIGGDFQDDVYAQRIVQDTPVAVLVDLISAVASPGRVDLVGFIAGQVGAHLVLYRRTMDGLATPLVTLRPDGEGHIMFRDLDVLAGTRYWYRLGFQGDGREVFSREIAVLVPSESQLSLTTSYAGPGDDDLTASLWLTGSGPATLELLDLSGRRLARANLGHLGPGAHTVSFPQSRSLPAGVYLIRLSEAENSIVRKSCLIR